MNIKTPKFSEALGEYFAGLELDEAGGQERVCRFSGEKFYVRPEDIEFYKKISVPLPTLSPKERARRRLAHNNLYNLFKTKSALTDKNIIAMYPPDTPYKVFEHKEWFGGDFDLTEYGIDYNSDGGFFSQYKKLQLSVPRPSLFVKNSVGSEYTNSVENLKNCYLVFDSIEAEDSAFCMFLVKSKNCYNCCATLQSDTCYGCVESKKLYKCFFLEFSRDCIDSAFLYDCRDCQNCFASTNLRHKKYCFLNEQLTKEEYEKKMSDINLGDRDVLNEWKDKFNKLKETAFRKPDDNERSVSCVGDFIKNSKNCYHCFYVDNGENVAYTIGGINTRESYDLIGGLDNELCYEAWGLRIYNCSFCSNVDDSRECEYSDLCSSCTNCFGCIGLRNKKFCIFNKQYSEEEYWEKLDEMKTAMLARGEYGEFFSPQISPFAYQNSTAMEFPGFEDVENAEKYGYSTSTEKESSQKTDGEILESRNVPEDIKDITYDILTKVIFDEKNNRKFRYFQGEIDFCKQYNLALPTEHYSVRMTRTRHNTLGSLVFKFYDRRCGKCGVDIKTTVPPDSKYTAGNIYCEQCYNNAVA